MPIKALPWHRPHTEQPSEHIVDIIELLRSYGLPSNTDIGFSAMAVHAGLSIKNMVTLSNCTARPCSQCPLRADEYKRLNFFLPICSMSSSSHLFSFAPCHHNLTYSHLFHVLRYFCLCCNCCQVFVHLLHNHPQHDHALLLSTKSTSSDRVSGFVLISYGWVGVVLTKDWRRASPFMP